ncbi:hypothetical protein [Sandaracinobacteroides saxicola]|uniref:Mercuric transport protein MerT n=1 Tax=Sandaracinobacteroides saxicola TaxID=2759707 RepID=A0A7G5IKM8_9SPHN|nr:hypothetical protein [Sandaracinobacteroides saxicola]QMW23920.1 hypothetical protein H3309_05460 [Sandaracinobacteroides saxicola]
MRVLGWRDTLAPTLSLFASGSTLVCCALPALLVSLGLGASLAGLVSAAPWLVELTRWKAWLFAGSGALLGLAALMQWRARGLPCPADAAAARACLRLRRVSAAVLALSALLWAVGAFFAFFAARLLL